MCLYFYIYSPAHYIYADGEERKAKEGKMKEGKMKEDDEREGE
jgi:hypothetical protein